MSRLALLFALCAAPFFLKAQTAPRYTLVRIFLENRDVADLARLGIEADHGDWSPGQFLQTELSERELAVVQHAGFQTQIIVPDVTAQYHADLAARAGVASRSKICPGISPYPTPENYKPGSLGGYHTYAEMLAMLDDMAAKFPHLVKPRAHVSDTLLTHEQRPLWYVKISDDPLLDENEPQVLYTALHHAREPGSMSQMLFFMWYLLENYDTRPEIRYLLDNEELYFIPCVNPDGVLFNEAIEPLGGGLWRKNRRDNGDGTFGVDLNRNYGHQWGITDQGSSPDPATDVYRGPAPFSEPESRMVRDFCRAHPFVFAHNYHTHGNLLIYPWAYNATLADSAFFHFARLFTRENRYKAGITFETVGYAVNGSAEDWMHAERGTYGYTPEVGRGGFWPMPEFIDPYNKANVWQNLSTALSALRFGTVDDLSADYWSQHQIELPMRFTRYGFQDGAFQVSLVPLTPNVSVNTPPIAVDVQHFKSKNLIFGITLAPTVQVGEEFVLLVKTESGDFSRTDTLRKFYGGKIQTLFTENGTGLTEWSGVWKPVTTTFVSAPSSVTDSPNGLYPNDASLDLTLNNVTVNIPAGARQPLLRFWAKWDIEDNRDYVVVRGIGNSGTPIPLCGRYTNTAAASQSGGNFPLYDGLQTTWVEECMDLSGFIGQSFKVQFRLRSNDQNQFDGFYFDDLRVEYIDPTLVKTVSVPVSHFDLKQNEPNPVSASTTIAWENAERIHDPANLLIFNALGEQVLNLPVDLAAQNQATLDTRTWSPGVYTYSIRSERWQTAVRSMVVVR